MYWNLLLWHNIIDYCIIITQNPDVVTGPVYQAVMNLMHTLWIGHKEFVLNFLRSRSDFWNGFCAPLFQKPRWVKTVTSLLSSPARYYVGDGAAWWGCCVWNISVMVTGIMEVISTMKIEVAGLSEMVATCKILQQHNPENHNWNMTTIINLDHGLSSCCFLFVFLTLQPSVVVFSQPRSGL